MVLIADSGSTKADWALLHEGQKTIKIIQTQGISPYHQTDDDINKVIANELVPRLDGEAIEGIWFYGSGCTTDQNARMRHVIGEATQCGDVHVFGDLIGAARALCGHHAGIACILGTGANSCVFDGEEITANIPPLGYILGDEGSGAVLGKMFMNGIFKGWLSPGIRDLYLSETNQTYSDIIKYTYREPLANRYLAKTAEFINRHKQDYEELSSLVIDNFTSFMRKNIDAYNRRDLSLNFVGSIAWYFKDELEHAVSATGYKMGKVIKSPIDGLVEFHKNIEH